MRVVSPSVTFWPSVASMSWRGGLASCAESGPVFRAHDDFRLECILDVFDAAIVIAVRVRDDEDFYVGRVEVQRSEAVFDLVFGGVCE